MKKNNTNIRDLYRRFSKEMDQLPLPPVEEIIEEKGETTHGSPLRLAKGIHPSGKMMPLNGNTSKRRWIIATAAAILAAILCISMLMKSDELSKEGNAPLIALNEEPSMCGKNAHGGTRAPVELGKGGPGNAAPTLRDAKDYHEETLCETQRTTMTDTLCETQRTTMTDTLCETQRTTMTETLCETQRATMTDTLCEAQRATMTDTLCEAQRASMTDTLCETQKANMTEKTQKPSMPVEESQRAFREKNSQREKAQDVKNALEKKYRSEQNDIYMTSPRTTTFYHYH